VLEHSYTSILQFRFENITLSSSILNAWSRRNEESFKSLVFAIWIPLYIHFYNEYIKTEMHTSLEVYLFSSDFVKSPENRSFVTTYVININKTLLLFHHRHLIECKLFLSWYTEYTDTRVHSVMFLIFIKIKYFPF
jgi:hypothetical protein